MSNERRINGVSALEMTMRDVMENMADFGTQMAYDHSVPGCFEILSIEPPETPVDAPREPEPQRTPVELKVLKREVA